MITGLYEYATAEVINVHTENTKQWVHSNGTGSNSILGEDIPPNKIVLT